jgi:hypothetical protein
MSLLAINRELHLFEAPVEPCNEGLTIIKLDRGILDAEAVELTIWIIQHTITKTVVDGADILSHELADLIQVSSLKALLLGLFLVVELLTIQGDSL